MSIKETLYPACKDLQKQKPNVVVTEETAALIGSDYRTMPIFEKGLYEYTYKKYYSFLNNELLNCRWKEYKKTFESRIHEPFEFPNVRDYHFYNCCNRLIISQSIFRRTDFRNKLAVGPGVDLQGQMPIPQDMMMKRGTQVPKTKKKKAPDNKINKKQEK